MNHNLKLHMIKNPYSNIGSISNEDNSGKNQPWKFYLEFIFGPPPNKLFTAATTFPDPVVVL